MKFSVINKRAKHASIAPNKTRNVAVSENNLHGKKKSRSLILCDISRALNCSYKPNLKESNRCLKLKKLNIN